MKQAAVATEETPFDEAAREAGGWLDQTRAAIEDMPDSYKKRRALDKIDTALFALSDARELVGSKI